MLSTDFAYLLSFIIFAYFTYKLGYKHAKNALNQGIETISDTIDKASNEKDVAQKNLNDLNHQLSEIQLNNEAFLAQLELRGQEISDKHRETLEALLKDRESYHKELLEQEIRLHTNKMKEEMLTSITTQFIEKISNDEKLAEAYKNKSLEMIKSAGTN